MRSNAGKVMTIYDIPSITKSAFDVAITAKNITAGFAATGTWPVNTDIFGEADFLPSQVTDRPNPDLDPELNLNTSTVDDGETRDGSCSSIQVSFTDQPMLSSNSSDVNNEPVAFTSSVHSQVLKDNAIEPIESTSTTHSPFATVSKVFSPESVRPLPKAPPRKNSQPHRRKYYSKI